MFETLLTLFLQVIVLLVVVPAVTSGNVAVRKGGLLRGLLILLGIGIVNWMLWPVLAIFTLGTVYIVQILSFGLVGILVNAIAFRIAGGVSTAFYVKSFGSAFLAAVTMAVANVVIRMVIGG